MSTAENSVNTDDSVGNSENHATKDGLVVISYTKIINPNKQLIVIGTTKNIILSDNR